MVIVDQQPLEAGCGYSRSKFWTTPLAAVRRSRWYRWRRVRHRVAPGGPQRTAKATGHTGWDSVMVVCVAGLGQYLG